MRSINVIKQSHIFRARLPKALLEPHKTQLALPLSFSGEKKACKRPKITDFQVSVKCNNR